MDKRIKSGLSANNFSGAYLGVSFERSLVLYGWGNIPNENKLGLLFGFQSRFFNRGHVDFSVGLFQDHSEIPRTPYERHKPLNIRNFVFATHATVGIAFGDWKKGAKTPHCNVLMCDELISDHWKVQLPDIIIGWDGQRAKLVGAYERKIGGSAFSVQADLDIDFYHYRSSISTMTVGAGVQLRHYFLQKMQVRHGKAGNNFSGPYWAVAGHYAHTKYSIDRGVEEGNPKNYSGDTSVRLSLGYQQRLFRRLYFDVSAFHTRSFFHGYQTSFPRFFTSSKMALGFTF